MVTSTDRSLRDPLDRTSPGGPHPALSERQRQVLLAVARWAMPPGSFLPEADLRCVGDFESLIGELDPRLFGLLGSFLTGIDLAAMVRYGRPLRRLPRARRDAFLEWWCGRSWATKMGLRLLLAPLKAFHFDDPQIFERLGCVFRPDPVREEPPRYMQKVQRIEDLEEDEELEVDAVVVGTGAGGAPVAHGLARRGHAVLMLEEGAYFGRKDFVGSRVHGTRKLYRRFGTIASVGNTLVPIPIGRTVGGTTTVNSGTCYRTPEWVLEGWRAETGLDLFGRSRLDPYFEKVEAAIGVEPARARYLTGVERVIARGCDRLGYRHGPLRRNAPDCDGQGFCAFGCPTDAKRSTNVSYVPMALDAGAWLFTGAKVERILTERGRAVGVVARGHRPDGSPVRLTVKARAVILSCGTLLTPLLLRKNKLLSGSRLLGRNLSIHPASHVMALFDEEIRGWEGIPQGYAIEEFHREGILFEGAFTPAEIATMAIPFHGARFMEIMEAFNRLAAFGFMVSDTSRGRVMPGLGGHPLIVYNLNRRDLARMKLGIEILCRVYREAGATTIFTPVHGHEDLSTDRAFKKFQRAKIRPRDIEMTAFHPLGTARMGADPNRSVVGEDHQAHGLPGLYIVDGGNLPGSPAVNPQVTIMALAVRAAERIAEAL